MSQNTRNAPSEGPVNGGGRSTGSEQENRQYEGFEGMNYEQRRQPYDPQSSRNKKEGGPGKGKRRDEL